MPSVRPITDGAAQTPSLLVSGYTSGQVHGFDAAGAPVSVLGAADAVLSPARLSEVFGVDASLVGLNIKPERSSGRLVLSGGDDV